MKKIVFSDIDGTLIHYKKDFETFGEILEEDQIQNHAIYRDKSTGEIRECHILPSSTMGNAYLSHKTASYIEGIRQKGMLFALISGARKSTFLKRLEILPKVDIAIAENGGRIYDEGKLDLKWAKRFESITGKIETQNPAEKRTGQLWDFYRQLRKEGWTLDSRDYSTNFRINLEENPQKSTVDLKNIFSQLPPELASTSNLGRIDFYPASSGKGNAAAYILHKKGIARENSYALIDDDNDLPLAEKVHVVLLPSISSDTVREKLKTHPEWIVAKSRGILATEELLLHILDSNS